jgi:hypothetical protein
MSVTLLKFSYFGKGFRDRKKERRIYEHLTNENDVITDDDIRNVRTDIAITGNDNSIDQDYGMDQSDKLTR